MKLPTFSEKSPANHGFALVATLVMMVLLTVLAVGLLSLSAISLRSSLGMEARRVAQSNARVALLLAIGELQKELGDDRRVTADASILGEDVARPNLVGIWRSAPSEQEGDPSPLLQPSANNLAPNYDRWKDRFEGWLVSDPDPEASQDKQFAERPAGEDAATLFGIDHDGIELKAGLIPIENVGARGALAWGVTQEATRAKINIGGDENLRLVRNDAIHAPARPNLGLSDLFGGHPEQGWQERQGKILNLKQAVLDSGYNLDSEKAALLHRDHTAHSRGVLADVVKGGLKTDLSLAFELPDNVFQSEELGGIENPLYGGTAPEGEVPLYQPIPNGGRTLRVPLNYSLPRPHNQEFDTGAPPTFNNLRSYYRMHHHLYNSSAGLTAFERPQASTYYNSTNSSAPRGSEMGISPVLDRVLFLLQMYIDREGSACLVFTPVVTLWNPYNVAIEAEGFVVYPWMDIPLATNWNVRLPGGGTDSRELWTSQYMGWEFEANNHGRQYKPYFYCQITNSGTDNMSQPITLEPGEVRVFGPAVNTPQNFTRVGDNRNQKIVRMKPVDSGGVNISGGIAVSFGRGKGQGNQGWDRTFMGNEELQARVTFMPNDYHYFVTMEDAGRIRGRAQGRTLAEIQVFSGGDRRQLPMSPYFPASLLRSKPQMLGVLETYHRTAATPGQLADVVYTVNPRQRYINKTLSGSSFPAGPHYQSDMRVAADLAAAGLQTSLDGKRAYYGGSNGYGTSPADGRDRLSFFELPREPMMSLGGFQTADLADTAFSPGNQVGNSWAPAYLGRSKVAAPMNRTSTGEILSPPLGVYDHCYLLNAALWDSFYFSSIAPETTPTSANGGPNVYNSPQASVSRPLDDVVSSWVEDPMGAPLRNPRHILHRSGQSNEEIISRLTNPSGPLLAASHMMVDGIFNVNSTSERAWSAMLASLRGQTLEVQTANGSTTTHRDRTSTPFPRLSQPTGVPGDQWDGFRELSDVEIEALAEQIVIEVRKRGPFQSLGEFVNRRMSNDQLGLKGALQAAIDESGLNDQAQVTRFDTKLYPIDSSRNLTEPYTGTGAPGWLTQGDLLTGLGPFLSVRSDTFTVRGYGEAHDPAGNIIARACCEAVVQRVPEWVDPQLEPQELPANHDQSQPPAEDDVVNWRFGRRFEILSFRELSADEMEA